MCSTTSPSYLISESAFDAVLYMHESGEEKLEKLLKTINETKKKLSAMGFSFAEFENFDPFRMAIVSDIYGFTEQLYDFMYDRGVVCEFCDSNSLVLIPSVMNTEEDFLELISVARKFEISDKDSCGFPSRTLPKPITIMSMTEAVDKSFDTIEVSDALNKVASEPITLYPPGTAILAPGELIGADMIEYLKNIGISKVKVIK